MVKSLTEKTTQEYHGRFLFELVQNAYDAHPADARDGQIAIRLVDTEGLFGTLYVANGGRPLTPSNARAISGLGISDKPVGEGIGNKGLGFKSVLEISDEPEVYSCSGPDDPGFNGYTFRFARPGELEQVAEALHLPSHLEGVGAVPLQPGDVEENLSRFDVIVPCEASGKPLDSLREAGYVTVIRLPLRSPEALTSVRARIEELVNQAAPPLLFLDRIARLTIQTEDRPEPYTLSREERELGGGQSVVTLDQTKQFLRLRRRVPARQARAVIAEAVGAGVMDRAWSRWEGVAYVDIALPDEPEAKPQLYTFLPLQETAASVMGGHVNAPFLTDYSRRGVDASHAWNACLLDEVGNLAREGMTTVAGGQKDPGWEGRLADLLAWRPEYLRHLLADMTREEAASKFQVAVMRGTNRSPETAPLASARLWYDDHSLEVFTASNVARSSDAMLLDAHAIGPIRCARLDLTATALGHALKPGPEQLAAWAESVAKAQRSAPTNDWDLFYADLVRVFGNQPDALRGRKVLLGQGRELLPCDAGATNREEANAPAVVFPPTRTQNEDEDEVDFDTSATPSRIRRHLRYLHPDLTWHEGQPRRRSASRRFLGDNNLVRRFDRRSLLEVVRRVLQTDPSADASRDCLYFAFDIWNASSTTQIKLPPNLSLRVPSKGGAWVDAADALFTGAWGSARGRDLELLAGVGEDEAPELAGLATRLLAPPKQVLRTGDSKDAWSRFLGEAGAGDTLPALSVPDNRTLYGSHLRAGHLEAADGIPEKVRAQWLPSLPETGHTPHPDTLMRADSHIWWLPGQGEIEDMPDRVREAYARLLVHLLGASDEDLLATTWRRVTNPRTRVEAHRATPAAAFLSSRAWLPTQMPDGTVSYQPCEGAWMPDPAGTDHAPAYARLAGQSLKSLVAPEAGKRLAELGVGYWGTEPHAARQLQHMPRLLTSVESLTEARQLRNDYQTAWKHQGRRGATPRLTSFVVDRGSRSEAWPAAHGAPLFVRSDDDDSVTTRILIGLALPMLTVPEAAKPLAISAAEALDRGEVKDVADAHITIYADGEPWSPSADAPLLIKSLDWLLPALAAVMTHTGTALINLGNHRITQLLELVRLIQLHPVGRLEVAIGDRREDLPAAFHGVLAIPSDIAPTLAKEIGSQLISSAPGYTWDDISHIAAAVLDLVGEPRLWQRLENLLLKLRLQHPAVPNSLDASELAAAVGMGIDEMEAVRGLTDIHHTRTRRLLYAAVAYATSLEDAAPLEPRNQAAGFDLSADSLDVVGVAARLLGLDDGAALTELCSESPDLDHLRKALGITLTDFNQSLRELGDSYPLINYGAEHEHAFAHYLQRNRPGILEDLRMRRVRAFDLGRTQADWKQWTSLTALTPDPNWGLTVDTLTDELIADQVEQLLAAAGDKAATPSDLPPRDATRTANLQVVEAVVTQATPFVVAWCHKHYTAPPPIWAAPNPAEVAQTQLSDLGAVDFRLLADRDDCIRWLGRAGLWPNAMPASLDEEPLGLVAADLDAVGDPTEQARLDAERERRSVRIGNERIDVGTSLDPLIDQLNKRIPALRAPSRGEPAPLAPIEPPAHDKDRVSTAGRPSRPIERLTDEQRRAIGFAGEFFVYSWLRHRYPDTCNEEAWVSRNREAYFPGTTGDDGAGFDFRIQLKTVRRLFEVKASVGDATQIQLGESEVRAAQAASSRAGEWRIAFVEHALSESPRLLLLANPFEERSLGLYRFDGKGLRLSFRVGE
ncbi:sacsin N-terminal ATP-binding-like domain-containing protein [Terrabacter ginsenosidimutans]